MIWNTSDHGRRLRPLAAEWAQISTIAAWELRIEELRAENRRLRQEGLWLGGPRDFLSVIHRNRHEQTHSALLAWLLDPVEKSGDRKLIVSAGFRARNEYPVAALPRFSETTCRSF